MAETNTNASMKELSPSLRAEIEASLEASLKAFKDEKTVSISIPKNLQDRVGQTVPFMINGVRIVLPVDGSKNDVPTTFADHIREYLDNVRL